jgi:hypothetical protein
LVDETGFSTNLGTGLSRWMPVRLLVIALSLATAMSIGMLVGSHLHHGHSPRRQPVAGLPLTQTTGTLSGTTTTRVVPEIGCDSSMLHVVEAGAGGGVTGGGNGVGIQLATSTFCQLPWVIDVYIVDARGRLISTSQVDNHDARALAPAETAYIGGEWRDVCARVVEPLTVRMRWVGEALEATLGRVPLPECFDAHGRPVTHSIGPLPTGSLVLSLAVGQSANR